MQVSWSPFPLSYKDIKQQNQQTSVDRLICQICDNKPDKLHHSPEKKRKPWTNANDKKEDRLYNRIVFCVCLPDQRSIWNINQPRVPRWKGMLTAIKAFLFPQDTSPSQTHVSITEWVTFYWAACSRQVIGFRLCISYSSISNRVVSRN